MARTSFKLSILFLLLISLSTVSRLSSAAAPDNIFLKVPSVSRYRTLLALQRNKKNQIPNCGEMASRSQCLQNPNCRWCCSEALDDMCFSKTVAWRLPQQVFLCEL